MSGWPFPITPPAAPGATWYETGTEEYPGTTFHHWRCKWCKRTAVTAGEKAPTACCCEAKR